MKNDVLFHIIEFLLISMVTGGMFLVGGINGMNIVRKEAHKAGVGGWVQTNDSQRVTEWQWYTNRSLNTNDTKETK
jgi:hypothetical protein